MVCTFVKDVSRFGYVELNDHYDKVVYFHEKNGNPSQSGIINAGVYLFNKNRINEMDRQSENSLEKDLFEKSKPEEIGAYCDFFKFCDLGIPQDQSYIEKIIYS